MGAETLVGLDIAANVAKATGAISQEGNTEDAIQLKQDMSHLQYLQRSNAALAQTTAMLNKQEALATTRGVNLGGSIQAIQRNTFNIGAKEQKNLQLEDSISKTESDIQKKNAKTDLFSSLFGDTLSGITDSAMIEKEFK